MLSAQDADDLLKGFPPVEFAFAYGSGVVEQGGYNYEHADPSKMPMLDLILVVDDSEAWHTANRSQNRSHYTPILPIGPKYIAQFQERIQANLWFNAYVPMTTGKLAGRLMKYGVISKQHLLDDLTGWTSLYTAGRLQKPVHILKGNDTVEAAMKSNLESAVRTSLLMLPEKFEEIDLYLSIASLSYVGDPRMYLGENPKKVVNLVTPIVPHYQKLYKGPLEALSSAAIITKAQVAAASQGTNSFTQNTSVSSRWALCLGLPVTIRKLLSIPKKERMMNHTPPNSAAVRAAVSSVVARAASMQTLKGLFTVGMAKGASYVLAKIGKRFLSPN